MYISSLFQWKMGKKEINSCNLGRNYQRTDGKLRRRRIKEYLWPYDLGQELLENPEPHQATAHALHSPSRGGRLWFARVRVGERRIKDQLDFPRNSQKRGRLAYFEGIDDFSVTLKMTFCLQNMTIINK